ncbi:hypothetical protein DLM46_16465 [Paraburkholderia lacunae]|uniref:DUF159 family protein n=1 Tax=Paraburkholderia lacunae TaxID=2211104 RepID=A0A370N737_9BURK|nr:hypothetical protein DLM46_16465 [Paraburkholderia lacunae]
MDSRSDGELLRRTTYWRNGLTKKRPRHNRQAETLGNRFYENVDRNGKNVVLQFDPTPPQPMLVARLWARTTIPDEPDLWSFAAITDEPPPEVAAAGHNRCIVPIKPENVDAWLNPDPSSLAEQYAILDDRVRPYYEHRMAA